MGRMKLNLNENCYKTSDLILVTTLSLYFPIEATNKDNSGRMLFIFKRSQDFDKLLNSFWRGELRVEPQKIFNQLKTIKSRIYAND